MSSSSVSFCPFLIASISSTTAALSPIAVSTVVAMEEKREGGEGEVRKPNVEEEVTIPKSMLAERRTGEGRVWRKPSSEVSALDDGGEEDGSSLGGSDRRSVELMGGSTCVMRGDMTEEGLKALVGKESTSMTSTMKTHRSRSWLSLNIVWGRVRLGFSCSDG